MKRVFPIGLCFAAVINMAPAFASGESNQCQNNLQKVRDAQAMINPANQQVKAEVDSTLHRAEAAFARNNDDGARECIALTQQALQKIQSN
ncbi:MAG: hypothetical protein PW845_20075 [Pseudomonas sp.]|uniref:hypothetical protein n=1 Tax=Pseudomonas abieticivorans TaxID=2931382 RepID=UPI0020BECA9E|nr:hypothetical protein [Pseudomonas sp. PIA16]MDE1167604.1 hypothetical protein [Pseudomonas sp.]